MKYIFSSEAVTEGHPDKVADRIADAILDACLKEDKYSRVACEVITLTDMVFIFGEITTKANVNYEEVARRVVKDIGYTKEGHGFDYKTMKVLCRIHPQSADIQMGVDRGEEKALGAGDQGVMFGYATDETKEYMPLGCVLAEELAKRLTYVRKEGIIPYLLPDGKTQVSVEYEDDKPLRVSTVLVSSQHEVNIPLEVIRHDIEEKVIREVIPPYLFQDTEILINPTGRFEIGGPAGDTGLTGRKIIVDTYGAYARHGGGAFSGKDATKVDRSASYALRHVAKNLVAAGLAKKVELQVSYAIGVSKPISLYVNSFGTSKLSDEELANIVNKECDLSPSGIITSLDLNRPIYENVSNYGHFSHKDAPWESLDLVETFKKYL